MLFMKLIHGLMVSLAILPTRLHAAPPTVADRAKTGDVRPDYECPG